jgi:HAD superfamily hydrolase (TIGR01509 family)
MECMANLRCVLLDIDGTLLDSNDAHARTWVAALRLHGIEVPFDRVRAAIGMGGDLLLKRFAALDADDPAALRISHTRTRMFLEELPSLSPFPRSRELLQRLKRQGLRLVVATSAGDAEMAPILERTGIADLVDAATSMDDADRSKPAPDIVTAALAKGGVGPDEALMLGDTPYDVDAARAAGVGIVLVRCGGWPFSERDGAVAVYDDPSAILSDFEASPFGKGGG